MPLFYTARPIMQLSQFDLFPLSFCNSLYVQSWKQNQFIVEQLSKIELITLGTQELLV